ncbi:hypothetical protein [Aeromonas media]|uniref:hypothetical protein n=1 Tax=Aeromonas media TaxID=651 RepID=UPI003D1F03CA
MTNADANVDTNVDTSTISNEMKLKAAYEVLKDKALIQEMINAHKIRFDELEGFHETIEESFDRNISLLHEPRIKDLKNKITNETANGGNIKTDTAKEMLSQSFLAIRLFKRKKDWISGELIRSGYARSEKVEKAISDFKVMIQTLEKCKDQFDGFEKDDKLDKIEKLMDELGLNHADLLKRIPENVLKDRKKKAENQDDSTSNKKRKDVLPKWYRFEHEGKEYFISRSPGGRVSGAIAKYLTLAGKTLPDLVVEESEVDQSKVITSKEHGKLIKKDTETQ